MSLFKDGVEGAIKAVGSIISDNTTTREEAAKKIVEAFELEIKDRESARELYKTDSAMQKSLIKHLLWGFYSFLLAFLIMTFYPMVFPDAPPIPESANTFISMVFGFFIGAIGTIKDFYFGGSKSVADSLKRKKD